MQDQQITLIEKLVYGGESLSKGPQSGKIVFLRGGLRNETVEYRITKTRKTFSHGTITKILKPSPFRTVPLCPYFGFKTDNCGGCDYQYIDYSKQLEIKKNIIEEQLKRIGKMEDINIKETIASPHTWGYRNIVQFHITPQGECGFKVRKSRTIIPIGKCLLLSEALNKLLCRDNFRFRSYNRVTARISSSAPGHHVLQIYGEVIPERNAAPGRNRKLSPPQTKKLLEGPDYIEILVKDIPFKVSYNSFFQVNQYLIPQLVDTVIKQLSPQDNDVVLDAYSGVGLFTRFIAPYVKKVVAVELNHNAVKDFNENLGELSNITLIQGSFEKKIGELKDQFTKIILDPPRSGCDKRIFTALKEKEFSRLNKLVMVSCNPATLARDSHALTDCGFKLRIIQPIDLFPQTYHIESVSLWER